MDNLVSLYLKSHYIVETITIFLNRQLLKKISFSYLFIFQINRGIFDFFPFYILLKVSQQKRSILFGMETLSDRIAPLRFCENNSPLFKSSFPRSVITVSSAYEILLNLCIEVNAVGHVSHDKLKQ